MAAKDTTNLLKQLRTYMKRCKYFPEPLNAYLVPSTDSHSSEYPADHDQRRAFISGFCGTAGSAVITNDHACMWTDGRYFLQASNELDSNWTLMKDGLQSTPSQAKWLISTLPPHSNVGVDPKVITHNVWVNLKEELEAHDHKLIAVDTNLIDLLWTDKPPTSKNPILPLELHFTGKTISQKIKEVSAQMKQKHVSILILSALDEIAWLLNLRGSDIECNPVFFSYVVIAHESVTLLIDTSKATDEIKEHFTKEAIGLNIKIEPYGSVVDVIKKSIATVQDGFVWLSNTANYSLTNAVPPKRLKTEVTPPALMKLIKNNVEMQGMRNAHIKDAVAVCCYFAWLEKAIKTQTVTEVFGSNTLTEFRARQADFKCPSFETTSAVGPHASIIHFKPEAIYDVPITTDSLYLCDSGAQFKDGTTDITRTIHFGTPTDYEKECFTRVLKGQLKLARSVFPSKVKGNTLDSFAREFLWSVGLDYAHGTGHGVGSYLNVHEGPIGISYKPFPDDPGLEAGMVLSNEPGYYEDGKFGIRIEDLVLVVPANPPHNFNNRGYLTFETLTWVPKQTKMIKTEMLTNEEILQLNSYHEDCRKNVGPILEKQGEKDARAWLWRETEPLPLK